METDHGLPNSSRAGPDTDVLGRIVAKKSRLMAVIRRILAATILINSVMNRISAMIIRILDRFCRTSFAMIRILTAMGRIPVLEAGYLL